MLVLFHFGNFFFPFKHLNFFLKPERSTGTVGRTFWGVSLFTMLAPISLSRALPARHRRTQPQRSARPARRTRMRPALAPTPPAPPSRPALLTHPPRPPFHSPPGRRERAAHRRPQPQWRAPLVLRTADPARHRCCDRRLQALRGSAAHYIFLFPPAVRSCGKSQV